VQRAAAFNRSLTRRAEAARAISPAASVQEPLPSSASSTAGAFSPEESSRPEQGSELSPAEPVSAEGIAPQEGTKADKEQGNAAAPLKGTAPDALLKAQAVEAVLPDLEAEGPLEGGDTTPEEIALESKPAAEAQLAGETGEAPSALDTTEDPNQAKPEAAAEARPAAQEPEQAASNIQETESQEQTGLQKPEQGTSTEPEQHKNQSGSGVQEPGQASKGVPEQASTPKAVRGLIQNAPQAELLPALMRQVMLYCSGFPLHFL